MSRNRPFLRRKKGILDLSNFVTLIDNWQCNLNEILRFWRSEISRFLNIPGVKELSNMSMFQKLRKKFISKNDVS